MTNSRIPDFKALGYTTPMNWIWITITDGAKILTPRFNAHHLPSIGHEIAYDGISGHVQSVKWTRHDEVTITIATVS